MGLLQPHVGRGRRHGQARLKTAVIANLAQARVALDAARARGGLSAGDAAVLATPPDAAIQYGVLFFVQLTDILRAEFPELMPEIAVDCGNRADLAHAALDLGLKHIVFRGDPRMAEKLANIAAGLSARLESGIEVESKPELNKSPDPR